MSIREYSSWNKRPTDTESKQEPFRKYFFICEGANTEQFYFKRLIDNKKELGIKPMIGMCLLEKDDDDRTISYPSQLIQFAENKKNDDSIGFDKKYDKMIIVFDADIFEYKSDRYEEIIADGETKGNILGVTNPSFELFLLLHMQDAFEKIIKPNIGEFLKEENLHSKGFAYTKVKEITGMNPKKNPKIGELADNIGIAIEQEKNINQDIHNCKRQVTSNIGKIVQLIIDDDGKSV